MLRGLEMVYRHLNANRGAKPKPQHWLVFVIREGYKFRCQEPPAEQLKKFCFFTTEVKLPNGKRLSLTSVHASVADDDVVGIFDGAVRVDPDGQPVLPKDDKTAEDEDRMEVDEGWDSEEDIEEDQEGADNGEGNLL
jgi:hypothetical protein